MRNVREWLDEYRELALTLGIRAGWSQPILTKDRQVLGTFAVYSPECRVPTDDDFALIEAAGHVTLLAIERQRSHEALTNALADVRKSETELRRMTDAVAQSIVVLNPDGKAISANRVALEYTGLRAVILCDGETFSVDPSWFAAERSKSPVRAMRLASDLAAHEKTMIENALRRHQAISFQNVLIAPTGELTRRRTARLSSPKRSRIWTMCAAVS